MRFVVFNNNRVGLIESGRVLDLMSAPNGNVSMFSSLASLIEAGARGLDMVRSVADATRDSAQPGLWLEVSEVELRAPWPGQRFALAGANHADHMANCFTNMGTPRTADEVRAASRRGTPSGFWGAARPVMGPDAHIQIPARANGCFDYEGEPAVVLGRQGKDIKEKDFSDFVWGVTLVIDWSIRQPQWPPVAHEPLMVVKNFDCSKSMGPCIVVDEVGPEDLHIETLVNGAVRQNFTSADMIFSFGEILEYLSRDFTVFPGDVLSGGTGAGTAVDRTVPNDDGTWPRELFLKPADRVEVTSPGIGSLANTVVQKKD